MKLQPITIVCVFGFGFLVAANFGLGVIKRGREIDAEATATWERRCAMTKAGAIGFAEAADRHGVYLVFPDGIRELYPNPYMLKQVACPDVFETGNGSR
jgi:hypothetical protein